MKSIFGILLCILAFGSLAQADTVVFKNGDKLQGFMIAGDDKKFVWAEAAISGDTVIVSSKSVPRPAAVRYAWANKFDWANLFNADGLPAQPFRTDSW